MPYLWDLFQGSFQGRKGKSLNFREELKEGEIMSDYQKYEQIKRQIDKMELDYEQREELLKIIAKVLNV